MHGTIFVQHLREHILATNCHYIKSFTIWRWDQEGTLVQTHIDKIQMITNQLTNINHQVSNENLAHTFKEFATIFLYPYGFT